MARLHRPPSERLVGGAANAQTVKVTFPDESVRDWPARNRNWLNTEIPRDRHAVEQVPIPNAEWTFEQFNGGWHAVRRD